MDGVPREASYDILAFFACSRWRLFGFCFLFFWIGFSFFGGEGELVVICDERGPSHVHGGLSALRSDSARLGPLGRRPGSGGSRQTLSTYQRDTLVASRTRPLRGDNTLT